MSNRESTSLEGRVVLVTGAASGIGLETVRLAAARGALVVATDIALSPLEELAGEHAEAGHQVLAVESDVTDERRVEATVQAAVARFGRLDAAVNCAGISTYAAGASGTVDRIDTAGWERLLKVNLTGVWLCMRYQLAQMRTQRSGSIVNIASIAGLVGMPGSSAYVAAKHGVVGLTKAAAIDMGPEQVRINAICPGFIDTPMIRTLREQRGDETLTQGVPLGRLGRAVEIAELAVWLCSDAASFASGDIFTLDGGYSAR